MSNLNLQKLHEWVWPWPWTFNITDIWCNELSLLSSACLFMKTNATFQLTVNC